MYNLEGIDISDLNHDRVCLNCIHWQANTQLYGVAKGVIYMITKEHTAPTDTYSQFNPTEHWMVYRTRTDGMTSQTNYIST